MRLSYLRSLLSRLGYFEVLNAVLERRMVIRWHRSQLLDDRCWIDDYRVWNMLSDTKPLIFPSLEEGMFRCREFYAFRKASAPDRIPKYAVLDSRLWNKDLSFMGEDRLLQELVKIQEAIRNHRDILEKPRTLEDDRNLYAILPEKVPPDFRLPAEENFLGENRAPKAGCPSFWRSHAACTASCHNLHAWGPCT